MVFGLFQNFIFQHPNDKRIYIESRTNRSIARSFRFGKIRDSTRPVKTSCRGGSVLDMRTVIFWFLRETDNYQLPQTGHFLSGLRIYISYTPVLAVSFVFRTRFFVKIRSVCLDTPTKLTWLYRESRNKHSNFLLRYSQHWCILYIYTC